MKKILITYNGKDYEITPEQWKSKYRKALEGKTFDYEVIDTDAITSGEEFLPANVEAEANAHARERRATQAQMEGEIAKARREAGTGAPPSFPYLREAYATGTDPEVGALRDLAALPGKGYGAVIDLFDYKDPRRAMGMTSEELAAKGRTGRSILASPSLAPSILTALYTGGMSIPTQIVGQAAANTALQPGYGEGSVALDAILTALPAGFSVAASKTKAAGIAAIKRALESKGIKNASPEILEKAYSSLSKVMAGKRMVKESGEALASDLAKPVAGASDIPKTGILRNLSRGAPVEIPTAAFDRARKSILSSVKAKGGRSLDEAREDISRVDAMEATQKRIAALQEEGGYATESYTRDIVDALKKVADIPELVKEAEGYISTAAESRAKDELQRVISAAFNHPPGLLANNIPDASFSQPLENIRAGTALQDIYGGNGRGILDVVSEPTVAARGVARSPTGKLVAEKGLRTTGSVAPSILNRLYYNEGEDPGPTKPDQEKDTVRISRKEYDDLCRKAGM